MEGIKPPFLVFATHQGPVDYYVGPLAMFPHRAMYVSDMEGFAAFGKWLYRGLGCIGKRRYVSDSAVVRNIKYALAEGQSVVVYPESRHSNVGTTAYIPDNLGKFAKMMGVPVVILAAKGNYLANPFWDEEHTRKVPAEATLQCICTKEELAEISAGELQKKIAEALKYDEYSYQAERHILIRDAKRAEGIHKPLYRCRHCGSKYKMKSEGAELYCTACNTRYELTEEGKLRSGDREFSIPEWYEWERETENAEFVRAPGDIREQYAVHIYALPNEKGFVDLGRGRLSLDKKEFELAFEDTEKRGLVCEKVFEDYKLHFPHKNRESVQTEYNYKGTGMCIVLSTKDCCYYIYSEEESFNPTRFQFIGEALYTASRTKRAD